MPTDKSGKFHLNPQVARMHDRSANLSKPMEGAPETGGEEEQPAKGHVEVHGHGDGSYHTVTHQPHEMADGQENEDGSMQHEHESMDAVHEHMKSHFGPEAEEGMEEEISPGIHKKVAAMESDDGGY